MRLGTILNFEALNNLNQYYMRYLRDERGRYNGSLAAPIVIGPMEFIKTLVLFTILAVGFPTIFIIALLQYLF